MTTYIATQVRTVAVVNRRLANIVPTLGKSCKNVKKMVANHTVELMLGQRHNFECIAWWRRKREQTNKHVFNAVIAVKFG